MMAPHGLRIVVALAAVTVFVSTLGFDFVWDDRALVTDNYLLLSPRNYLRLLSTSFWDVGGNADRFRQFFRPVVTLTYIIDFRLHGKDPLGFHAFNMAIHALCALLCQSIFIRGGLKPLWATAGALLFAVHPIHVENVAWISGRTDLLATLFGLATFRLLMPAAPIDRRGGRLIAATCCFALACLSKENALTLVVLVPLYWVLGDGPAASDGRPTDSPRPALGQVVRWLRLHHGTLIVLFASSVLVLVLRTLALSGNHTAPLYALKPAAWLATAVFALARYLFLWVVPLAFDAHHPDLPLPGLMDTRAAWALGVHLLVGVVTWLFRKRDRKVFFWLAWVYIGLSPVMLFGRFGDVIIADRFLYLPSVGLCWLSARGLQELAGTFRSVRLRGAVVGTTALVLLALAARTHLRAQVWKSDRALFADMVQTSPQSALVQLNRGLTLLEMGKLQDARVAFQAAIDAVPDYAQAWNNRGVVEEKLGEIDAATESYQVAIQADPDHRAARINLGSLLVRRGLPEPGLSLLQRAHRRWPDDPQTTYLLADALLRIGALDAAAKVADAGIAKADAFADLHFARGAIAMEQGDFARAVDASLAFLARLPADHPNVPWGEKMLEAARQAQAGRAPAAPAPSPE